MTGVEATGLARVTTTSDRHQQPGANARAGAEIVCCVLPRPSRSGGLPEHDALRNFADRDQPPERDQQFPGEGHDQGRLAGAFGTFGSRPVPLRQRAVLLEPEKGGF